MSEDLNDMLNDRYDAVFELLVKFNEYFPKNLRENEKTLGLWADLLAIKKNYKVKQVVFALEALMNDGRKFMPSASEIIQVLTPKPPSSEDQANTISSEVIEKAIEFGIHRIQEAFDALSEPAKITIGSARYIADVCNSTPDTLPTIRAQIRNLAKARLETISSEKRNQSLHGLGIDTGKVLEFKTGMRALDFNEFNPQEDEE